MDKLVLPKWTLILNKIDYFASLLPPVERIWVSVKIASSQVIEKKKKSYLTLSTVHLYRVVQPKLL